MALVMNLGDCHQRSGLLKQGITFDRDNIIGKQLTISLVLKQQAADEFAGQRRSAGREKKDWGRCWEGVVAMGVASVRKR